MERTIKKLTVVNWKFKEKVDKSNLQEKNVISITQNFLWTTLWYWEGSTQSSCKKTEW